MYVHHCAWRPVSCVAYGWPAYASSHHVRPHDILLGRLPVNPSFSRSNYSLAWSELAWASKCGKCVQYVHYFKETYETAVVPLQGTAHCLLMGGMLSALPMQLVPPHWRKWIHIIMAFCRTGVGCCRDIVWCGNLGRWR